MAKKENNIKTTVGIGVAGAVVGAAAGAAALALSDKKNRKKVLSSLSNAKEKSTTAAKKLGSKSSTVLKQGRKTMQKTVEKVMKARDAGTVKKRVSTTARKKRLMPKASNTARREHVSSGKAL